MSTPPTPDAPAGRSLLGSFGLSQVASGVATGVDVLLFAALTQLEVLAPAPATVAGALLGAVTNFVLGRNWVFLAAGGRLRGQLVRYVAVVVSSIFWNTAVVALLTGFVAVPPVPARIAASVIVAVLHNFPLLRWVVFRSRPGPGAPG